MISVLPVIRSNQTLKYNIIPLYRRTIHFIQSALEEEERNTLFQMKVLREKAARETG